MSVENMSEEQVFELCANIRRQGYAVVCFTQGELRGANPRRVEDRLVELGWDVIDVLADEEV